MPNGTSIFGLLNALQSTHISVYQHRCAVVRNRNAECMRCAQACTSGCIALVDGKLQISPERCIGCGTCATVCPTCALEAHNPSDASLFAQCVDALRATEGVAVIACKRQIQAAGGRVDPRRAVGVECLGRVEESLLAMLSGVGATQVKLVAGPCESCPHHTGRQAAEAVCATANALFEAWARDTRVRISDTFPRCVRLQQDGYDPNRRKFFADAAGAGRAKGEAAVNHALEEQLDLKVEQPQLVRVGADKTLPHFVPGRRRRLVHALQSFGEPRDMQVGVRLWGHVEIDPEKCDACQMCATFCPTGAIRKFAEADGSFGVEHVPRNCVKCRCCTDICHTGALRLTDEVDAFDITHERVERYRMKPRRYVAGDLRELTKRVADLTGVEEVYDH